MIYMQHFWLVHNKNLFNIDYCDAHPGATKDVCNNTFDELGNEEVEKYKALSAKCRREVKRKEREK